jgi:hypothetical protein
VRVRVRAVLVRCVCLTGEGFETGEKVLSGAGQSTEPRKTLSSPRGSWAGQLLRSSAHSPQFAVAVPWADWGQTPNVEAGDQS